MPTLDEILCFNKEFVENKQYEPYKTSKNPNKKIAILTCMDTRLTELLPKAMNLRNGDAKIIKSAGALVGHPFGAVMKSILVAVYELNAEEVYVIGHHDCGMSAVDSHVMVGHMRERGISEEIIQTINHSGFDLYDWLQGFGDVEKNVLKNVDIIRSHPLFPKNTPVHGLVIDPETGKLDLIANGYEYIEKQ